MAQVALGAIGFLILLIGTVLHLVGTVTHEWVSMYSNNAYSHLKVHIGLYSACLQGICIGLDEWFDVGGRLLTVRAMTALGIVGSGLACLIAIVFLVQVSRNSTVSRVMGKVVIALCIVASMLNTAGIIVFATDFYGNNVDYGYSFYLVIVGTVLILIGGCVFVSGAGKAIASIPAQNQGQVIGNNPYVYNTQQNMVYNQGAPGYYPPQQGYPLQQQGYPPQQGYPYPAAQPYGVQQPVATGLSNPQPETK